MALAAEYGDDPEMIQAIIASMKESEAENISVPDEPAADADPASVVNLQLRLPDGSKLQRKFLRTNTLGDVFNFVKKNYKGQSSQYVKLMTTFPKKVFEDGAMTIADAKFSKQEALNVDCK
mmetsp:Transcript_19597/g.30185  ORF Transcript_19597/g.30185 Transcript_19597/m.30185 type:complete len:121 (-) Transcript_19597:26-388(-)